MLAKATEMQTTRIVLIRNLPAVGSSSSNSSECWAIR